MPATIVIESGSVIVIESVNVNGSVIVIGSQNDPDRPATPSLNPGSFPVDRSRQRIRSRSRNTYSITITDPITFTAQPRLPTTAWPPLVKTIRLEWLRPVRDEL